MKHTEGPWKVKACGKYAGAGLSIKGPDGRTVATVMRTLADKNKASNAALIAAAPDLLDALTDLVGGCGKEGDLFSSAAMDKCRAAIAKATGESQ